MGTKKLPFYRIVVTDKRSPRGGRFIERVGTWDPRTSQLRVEGARIQHWAACGAQISETVTTLLKQASVAVSPAAPAQAG